MKSEIKENPLPMGERGLGREVSSSYGGEGLGERLLEIHCIAG